MEINLLNKLDYLAKECELSVLSEDSIHTYDNYENVNNLSESLREIPKIIQTNILIGELQLIIEEIKDFKINFNKSTFSIIHKKYGEFIYFNKNYISICDLNINYNCKDIHERVKTTINDALQLKENLQKLELNITQNILKHNLFNKLRVLLSKLFFKGEYIQPTIILDNDSVTLEWNCCFDPKLIFQFSNHLGVLKYYDLFPQKNKKSKIQLITKSFYRIPKSFLICVPSVH